MKNTWIYLLAVLTLVFAAFVAGFYVGRNTNSQPMQIYTAGTPSGEDEASASLSAAKVDINTATKEELMTIPGVGAVLAQRIVDYRATHGNFQNVAELCNVSGIGPSTLDAIREYIIVGG